MNFLKKHIVLITFLLVLTVFIFVLINTYIIKKPEISSSQLAFNSNVDKPIDKTDSFSAPEQYNQQLENQTNASPSNGMPACICHSKKPSMVKMHDALDGQDCGSCHKPGENLMDPNRKPSTKEQLNRRISNEIICQSCHKANGQIVVDKSIKSKIKITGAYFCPKCKKQLSTEDTTCGNCNGLIKKQNETLFCSSCGPLVDINKIAKLAKEKPSNEICLLCHYNKDKLLLSHRNLDTYNKNIRNIPDALNKCLNCHKSHNQCGGCHF